MKYLVEPLLADSTAPSSSAQRTFSLTSLLSGEAVNGGSSVLTTARWSELDTQRWQLTPATSSTGQRYYRVNRQGSNLSLTVEGTAAAGFTVAERTLPLFTGTIAGGNDQQISRSGTSVPDGAALFAPLLVKVTDSFGTPVSGVQVSFSIGNYPAGMAVQINPSGATTPVVARTDSSGIARLALMDSGTKSVSACYADGTFSIVASVSGGNQFTFTQTVVPTATTSYVLSHASGNNQTVTGTLTSGSSYTATFAPLKVRVTNSAGGPVTGAGVSWRVYSKPSGMSIKLDPNNAQTITTATDGAGVATLSQLNAQSMITTGTTGAFCITASIGSNVAYFVGMTAAPAVAQDPGLGGPQAWVLEEAGTAGVRFRSIFASGYLQLQPATSSQEARLTVGEDLGGSGKVEVFVDKSYGGRSMSMGLGRFNVSQLLIGNDQASSIKVASGYKATVFADHSFKGGSRGIVADSWYLTNFNDVISSIIVQPYRLTLHEGRRSFATLYADGSYAGSAQSLDVGLYSMSELWFGNDLVSSISIPSDLEVVLCADDWFWGTQKVFTASATSVGDMNDKTSSVIVRQANGPTVTVYSGTNYTGTPTVLKVGAWAPNATGSFANTAGSLRIPSSLMVTGYNKSGFLTAPMYGDRATIPWSSASGSALLVEPAMPVVFTSTGQWQKLRPGSHNSTALTIGATNITRIQVPEGYIATLFTEDGFTGGRRSYGATGPIDLPADITRRIRSISVEPVESCVSQFWRLGLVRGLNEVTYPRASVSDSQILVDVAIGTWNGFGWNISSDNPEQSQANLDSMYVLSVKVPEGLRLTLFSENNLSGNYKAYTRDTTLSSPFLARSSMLEPVVCLYENADRSGKRVELGVGRFDLGASNIAFGDKASAIKVPLGLIATLYQNSNHTGISQSFVEDAVLDSTMARQASSIVVRPLAFPIPRSAIHYGNQVNFKCGDKYLRYFPDTNSIKLSTEPPPTDPELGNYGDFRIVRAGATPFPHLVSFGDAFALRTTVGGYYVVVASDGKLAIGGTNTSDAWPFILVRAGTTTHNQLAANNDSVALMSATGKYLTTDGSTAPAMTRDSLGSLERFLLLDAAANPVTAQEATLSAYCELNVCGAAACTTDQQLVGANPEASYLSLFCAGDTAGVLSFGDVNPQAKSAGTTHGTTVCGADICSAAACGAAACGAAACFQEANGVTVCGADACYSAACGVAATGVGVSIYAACGIAASGVSAGGVTICGVDACGVDACPIDLCGADACGVDVVPFVPFI